MTRLVLLLLGALALAAPARGQTAFQEVVVSGEQPRDISLDVRFTLAPVLPATPSTRLDLTATGPAGLRIYVNGVLVTAPPIPPASVATLTANPTSIAAGGSSVLTLFTPTLDYHNVFINGVRPVGVTVGTSTTWTLTVTPSVTTTYKTSMTNSTGVPWPVLSATVTVP